MYFLRKFLYSRGPTLKECIQKALRNQETKENNNNNNNNEQISNDDEANENQMVTVMSPIIPDGVRNIEGNQENNLTVGKEESFSMEYQCDEAPQPRPSDRNFTFAIPKLEPIEIDEQLQYMSTPIAPPKKKLRGEKRSLPDGMQIRNIKIQKVSTSPKNDLNVSQFRNVKIQRISTSPSEHYNVACNDQENVKSLNCTKIQRLTSNQSLNSSVLKPHNYPACSCTADGDMMFMQSLVPDVKKLNSEQRMAFKVQVHQLLQNILYKKR